MASTGIPGLLSGSTNGLPIPVVATSSTGTTIHTAQTGTAGQDMITIYASNVTASYCYLVVQWGSVSDPGNDLVFKYNLEPNSLPKLIANYLPLNNTAVVRAWAQTASAINITGSVLAVTY